MEMLHTDRRGSYLEMEAEALDRLRSMGVTGSKMDAFSKPDMFNRAAEPAATPCAMKTLLNIVAEAQLEFASEAAPVKPASPFSGKSPVGSSPAPTSLTYNVKFEFANPFLQSALETVKDLCSKSKSACLTFVRQSGVAPIIRLLKAINQDNASLLNALGTLNFVLQKTLFSGSECMYEGSKALEDLAVCEALSTILPLLKSPPNQEICNEAFRLIEVMSCKDYDSFLALKHAGGVELLLQLAFPRSSSATSAATQQQAEEMLIHLARAEISSRKPKVPSLSDSVNSTHGAGISMLRRGSSNWADHQARLSSRNLSMVIPEKSVLGGLGENKEELQYEQLMEYAINTMGKRPIHWAAQLGELVFLGALLEEGAAPDTADIFGNTPLHLAAMNSHLAVVKSLLAVGCDSSRPNIESKVAHGMAKPDSECYNHLVSDQYVNALLRTPRPCQVALAGALPEPSTSAATPTTVYTASFFLHTGVVAIQGTSTATPTKQPSRAFACYSPPPLEPIVTQTDIFIGVPYKANISADRAANAVIVDMPGNKAQPEVSTTVVIATSDPEGLCNAIKKLHKNSYQDANKAAAKVVEYKKLWQEYAKVSTVLQENLGKAFVEMLAVKDRAELDAIRNGREGADATQLGVMAAAVFKTVDKGEESLRSLDTKLADAKTAMLNIISGLVANNERQLQLLDRASGPDAEARAMVVKERIACLNDIAAKAKKLAKDYPVKHKIKVNFEAERVRLASMLGVDMQHGPVVSAGLATVDSSVAARLTGEKGFAKGGEVVSGGSSSRQLPPSGRKSKTSSSSKSKKASSSSVDKGKKKSSKDVVAPTASCMLQADSGLDIDLSAMLSGLPSRSRAL